MFIPAHQLGTLVLHFFDADVPKQLASESEEAYHERIRKFLNDYYPTLKGFAVFDETNRFQIDLPTWSRTKPKDAGEMSSDKRNP
jgi:hypothetical protein